MSRKLWIRLAIWAPIVLAALGYRWYLDHRGAAASDREGRHDAAPDARDDGTPRRVAPPGQWSRSIEALGRDRFAKRLVWKAIGPSPLQAGGDLVWFHDGESERVAYLSAPDDPPNTALAVLSALRDGRAVLFPFHGDPSLGDRLLELRAAEALPPGWVILLPPDLSELVCNRVRARIVETEAYQGEADRACHAHAGRTRRSEVLYREAGTLYCYLCYGIHVLLNLVCDRVDEPSAVLVRGVVVTAGEAVARERRGRPRDPLPRLTNGPGKVTQALGLDLEANASHLDRPACPLAIHRGPPPETILSGPRVGIAYAGPEWAAVPWRFHQAGCPVART